MLFLQLTRLAFSFAPASAGSNIAARMAMMAITTSSSINVNASGLRERIADGNKSSCMLCLLFRFRHDEEAVRRCGVQVRDPHDAIGERQGIGQLCPLGG